MLDNYDMEKLAKAKKILDEIYEYNYSPSCRISKRLETIISKIEDLEKINK